MAIAGHNGIDADSLGEFIERIERLEEEKRGTADDIKEVYAEAKVSGFDPKIMRKIVAMRRISAAERAAEQEIIDLYMAALGEFINTPLGHSAVERATASK